MFTKPIRTDFGTKYGNSRWIVNSIKIDRTVYLFSDLEYANWLKTETDPSIKFFCEQPILIESVNKDGKTLRTIPDMYILYANGIEAIREVKYKNDFNSERAIQQSSIQKEWCIKNNYKYEVVSEDELLQNYILLSNLKLLSKFESEGNEEFLNEVKKHLLPTPQTLSQIAVKMNVEFEDVAPLFFTLIKRHDIKSNILDLFLGPLTEVWANAT